jgi:hypothetical protein
MPQRRGARHSRGSYGRLERALDFKTFENLQVLPTGDNALPSKFSGAPSASGTLSEIALVS